MTFFLAYWKWFAAAAVIGVLTIAYNLHVNGLIKAEVTKAVTERDTEWRKSEQKAVDAAIASAKMKEAKQSADFKAIEANYEKEKANAQKAADARVAAVRAGSRLRVSSGCTGAANVPGPATSPAGSPAPAAAQFLNESDSAFLLGEAARADEITRTLNTCQTILKTERLP